MKSLLIRFVIVCACVVAFAVTANGQKAAAKVPVVIVGSAAKGAWVTTKFVAGHVAKPVLKGIFLKAAPKMGMFALKRSPGVAKRVVPIAVKLALL